MDDIRKQAKSGRASKLARFGGMASDISRVKNGMPGRAGYATGGAVEGGGDIGGAPAPRNLSKPGRKMAKPGKDKKGTTINIVVAGGGGKPGGPPPDMPMPPPQAGPPPPMIGPGPGGPPMPMRRSGGAVGKYAKGGRVKRADGGQTTEKRARAAGELDEKEQGKYLRGKSKDAWDDAKTAAGSAAMSAGARAAMSGDGPSGIGYRLLKGANTLFAGTSAAKAIGDTVRSRHFGAEADKFDKADRDEERDRKSGGRVGRKC